MTRNDAIGGAPPSDLLVVCVCGHQNRYDLAAVRPDHAYRCDRCGDSLITFKPSDLAALWREQEDL